MYYVEFFLTRRCNQTCYYCNIFRGNSMVMVDTDKVKYILDNSPPDLGIEMTGGEIGLIENIDDVFKTIYNHKYVKKIIALSNGLIRKRGVDWLDKVDYVEHLIKDINGKDVIKFYDLDFIDSAKNIIITSEVTTKSILDNWDYFKTTEFLSNKFYIKLMNNKTHTIEKYYPEVVKLFTLLNDKRQLKMVNCFHDEELYINQKKICEINTPNPFIDFEDNLIGHCAILFNQCEKKPFTLENYKLLPKGKLFHECEYCKSCYSFDDGDSKINFLLECRKEKFKNRNYINDPNK